VHYWPLVISNWLLSHNTALMFTILQQDALQLQEIFLEIVIIDKLEEIIFGRCECSDSAFC